MDVAQRLPWSPPWYSFHVTFASGHGYTGNHQDRKEQPNHPIPEKKTLKREQREIVAQDKRGNPGWQGRIRIAHREMEQTAWQDEPTQQERQYQVNCNVIKAAPSELVNERAPATLEIDATPEHKEQGDAVPSRGESPVKKERGP